MRRRVVGYTAHRQIACAWTRYREYENWGDYMWGMIGVIS